MTRKTRRLPVVQPAGTSIVRAYQAMEALSGTPESGLPQGNGTTIARGAGSSLRDHPWASPTSCPSNWNSHDPFDGQEVGEDRKSTRLTSSHVAISYAGFCLTKKTS